MQVAKINEETGEVISEGYYCDSDCRGCSCHMTPPCNHCYDCWKGVGDNVFTAKKQFDLLTQVIGKQLEFISTDQPSVETFNAIKNFIDDLPKKMPHLFRREDLKFICDETTNSQESIDAGYMIAKIVPITPEGEKVIRDMNNAMAMNIKVEIGGQNAD